MARAPGPVAMAVAPATVAWDRDFNFVQTACLVEDSASTPIPATVQMPAQPIMLQQGGLCARRAWIHATAQHQQHRRSGR